MHIDFIWVIISGLEV